LGLDNKSCQLTPEVDAKSVADKLCNTENVKNEEGDGQEKREKAEAKQKRWKMQ